jgi:hypothetical protein
MIPARHDRQILKEQHAHDLPAMHCVELNSLGQQFGEDSRGRHRQDAAEGDAELPVDAGDHHQAGNDQHADGDLQQAQAKNDALHRIELG